MDDLRVLIVDGCCRRGRRIGSPATWAEIEEAVNRVQAVIDRVRSPDCPADELLAALRTGPPIVVANVLDRMGSPGVVPLAAAIEALAAAAGDPRFGVRLMGSITLAHLAVAALMRLGGEARERGASLLANWPERERGDLYWFLRSEGIVT